MRKINCALEKALCLLGSLLVCVSFTQAATNDVTGVMPTLTVTFDASAVANANGTGSLTYSAEGTPTYVTSPNGKAIDMMLFTPYGNVTSVTTSSNDFTVSAFATLGPNNTGIMFHLRDDEGGSKGGLVVRRGTNANEVVVTVGTSTAPVMTARNIDWAESVYHHYAVVAVSNGLSLYVDGALRATTAATSWALQKKNYQFGSRHGGVNGGEVKYGGKMDDFRIYPVALTAEQIKALSVALTSAGFDAGAINIKTGSRSDAASDGNVSVFGSQVLGPVPFAATTWNKMTNGVSAMAGVLTNLQNTMGVITGVKMYYATANTYAGLGPSTVPNSVLTKTYLDDGTAPTYTISEGNTNLVLPNPGVTRGWEVMLANIPYQHADLYVILASDQNVTNCTLCPVMLKVGDGAWTYYYGLPGIGKTQQGYQTWAGAPYSSGPLNEGEHYVKIPLSGLTTNTSVAIAHGSRNTGTPGFRRIGLAGLQLVRRDSAYVAPDDPFYLRTITGSANWSDVLWTHAGINNVAWTNSTSTVSTIAQLTTSGTTTLTLPNEGVTANTVSVGGTGAFSLAGSGALTLTSNAVLDVCGLPASEVVTLSATILGSNVTLVANNTAAYASGYTLLSSAANDFDLLTVRRGALHVQSALPADVNIALNDGALVFTQSGTFARPITLIGASGIRVGDGLSASITSPLQGGGSLNKIGSGALTLNGGGSLGDLLWSTTGTINLSGSTPFALSNTVGNGFATTVNVTVPVTLSGTLSLGSATMPIETNVLLAANALRWGDNGFFTTTVTQTSGRLVTLGNNTSIGTSASIIFANTSSAGSTYTLNGGDFLATNAVAMLSLQGKSVWSMGGTGHAYVKGINMKGSASTNSDCSAELIMTGGSLEIGDAGVFASNTARPRAMTFGAGLIRAISNFTFSASAVSTAVALTDAATGLTLDLNGKTIAWAAPLSGTGKLVVTDLPASAGRLRLQAASTHSGGVELRGGTVELGHVSALGTGAILLSGSKLEIGAMDIACGALTVTNTATLSVRIGLAADYSNSGCLTASSVGLNNTATNTLSILVDVNGLSTPVAAYPVLLSPSLPVDALSKMTVVLTNSASLPVGATVSLEQRADGIYACFSGVTSPRNLFWRNGVAAGTWSMNAGDTPWGEGSASASAIAYTALDTINLADTDQGTANVTVLGTLSPIAMNINNAATAYSLTPDINGGTIRLLSANFLKSGAGTATVTAPMLVSNTTLTVSGGTLQVNAALGTVASAPANMTAPIVVTSNAVLSFGYTGNTQMISGVYSGTGTVRVTDGRLKIASVGLNYAGTVVAAGGTLEVALSGAFFGSPANLRVEAGATMEFTALDASGYNVTNTQPIDVAGTLIFSQRDSTGRGIRFYDGGRLLLKGVNMDSTHAMDLFSQPIISLVSGTASISPLDPANASQATIIVRPEHVLKTFDVQASNAVLTVETPLFGGSTANIIDKIGPGTLLWTGTNTTVAKLRASAGTFAIGGSGALSANGTTSQAIDILAGATFRYGSSGNQTLSGAIVCSGTFEKSGVGLLTITGALALNAGGELALPALAAAGDAVKINALALNGGTLRVTNLAQLHPGITYTLLTSDNTLPSGILATVTGLPAPWRVSLSSTSKAVQLYKPFGSLLLIN